MFYIFLKLLLFAFFCVVWQQSRHTAVLAEYVMLSTSVVLPIKQGMTFPHR
jgi:hypothetical protein